MKVFYLKFFLSITHLSINFLFFILSYFLLFFVAPGTIIYSANLSTCCISMTVRYCTLSIFIFARLRHHIVGISSCILLAFLWKWDHKCHHLYLFIRTSLSLLSIICRHNLQLTSFLFLHLVFDRELQNFI